jgi:hypothetical protein
VFRALLLKQQSAVLLITTHYTDVRACDDCFCTVHAVCWAEQPRGFYKQMPCSCMRGCNRIALLDTQTYRHRNHYSYGMMA